VGRAGGQVADAIGTAPGAPSVPDREAGLQRGGSPRMGGSAGAATQRIATLKSASAANRSATKAPTWNRW